MTGNASSSFRLDEVAERLSIDPYSRDFAEYMDSIDELASYRDKFYVPTVTSILGRHASENTADGIEVAYFCGNSLGLQPKRSRQLVVEELDKWAIKGVNGCGSLATHAT
jgi:kynureninase